MGYSHTNSRGTTYYLRNTTAKLRGGQERTIYFFTKDKDGGKGEACDLPEGRVVYESPRNGFLVLKKKES